MRHFSEIVRNIIDQRNLRETLRESYPGLFHGNVPPEDDRPDNNKQDESSNKAYGLFNSGQFDPNLLNGISLSPHPIDLMEDLSFEERSKNYEVVLDKFLYKKILREGAGQSLKDIAIYDLAIKFHCNIFIPGVSDPIISTYGFRNAPTVLVKKLVCGFVYALSSMLSEECSQFLISSKLVFGRVGNCHIPPNTDLIVILDLQEIAVSPSAKFCNFIPAYMREHIDGETAFKYAQLTFNEGKEALKNLDYSQALTILTKAKFFCEKVSREEHETKWFHFNNLHTSIYLTLATTHFRLQEYHRCVKVLRTLRRYMHHDLYAVAFCEGLAYEEMGSFKSALNSFKLCYKVFPSIEAFNAIARLHVKVDVIKLNTF